MVTPNNPKRARGCAAEASSPQLLNFEQGPFLHLRPREKKSPPLLGFYPSISAGPRHVGCYHDAFWKQTLLHS